MFSGEFPWIQDAPNCRKCGNKKDPHCSENIFLHVPKVVRVFRKNYLRFLVAFFAFFFGAAFFTTFFAFFFAMIVVSISLFSIGLRPLQSFPEPIDTLDRSKAKFILLSV